MYPDERERDNHLDKLMRLSAFLMEKYRLERFPDLELAKHPIEHICDNGNRYFLKGLWALDPQGRSRITVLDDSEVQFNLCHEVLHHIDYLNDNLSKDHDTAREEEANQRASLDLREFELADGLRKIAKMIVN